MVVRFKSKVIHTMIAYMLMLMFDKYLSISHTVTTVSSAYFENVHKIRIEILQLVNVQFPGM